jgi:hypothetical protein
MYGGMYGHENKFEMWTFDHVDTDTMTARLIDIASIAEESSLPDGMPTYIHADGAPRLCRRKVDRRVVEPFKGSSGYLVRAGVAYTDKRKSDRRKPIADAAKMVDERKGERRSSEDHSDWDSYSRINHGRRFSTTNDRRRTPGTRAMRGQG